MSCCFTSNQYLGLTECNTAHSHSTSVCPRHKYLPGAIFDVIGQYGMRPSAVYADFCCVSLFLHQKRFTLSFAHACSDPFSVPGQKDLYVNNTSFVSLTLDWCVPTKTVLSCVLSVSIACLVLCAAL